ncbi:hypothetical protein N431DRAFT_559274 [Stipitochalara longipes BDJ]|nr:hypothetical protein N431DRAFT_559274 [Stipitochalara longipes BDJ]
MARNEKSMEAAEKNITEKSRDDAVHVAPLSVERVHGGLGEFIRHWWKALAAIVLMLLAAMAIILVLALHQNKPLPDWPLSITLNSLISIMLVILKWSMLVIITAGELTVDNAMRRQIMASAALVVIVIAAAIDPFTQQVIHYYQVNGPSDTAGNATMPRTTVYGTESLVDEAVNPYARIHNLLGATNAGFWTPGSDAFTVSVRNCTTGDCTFDEPYRTLGIRGVCTDETSQITGTSDGSSWINYSTPTGTMLAVFGNASDTWIVGNATASISTPGPPGYLAAREFIWTGNTNASSSSMCQTQPCPSTVCKGTACPVSAAVCYLYPSIDTYTASVTNGNITETLLSSIPIPGDCRTCFRRDCLTPSDWELISSDGINQSDDSDSDYISLCNTSLALQNITTECYYSFASSNDDSFIYVFNTSAAFNKGLFLAGSLTGVIPTVAFGQADLYYLYDTGKLNLTSLNSTFSSIATAISALVRLDDSTPANGTIYFQQTIISVQWEWLIFPLALIFLTIVFAFAVMIQTSTNGRKLFGKPSSLLFLLYGVAGQVAYKHNADSAEGSDEGQEIVGMGKDEDDVMLQMKETEQRILRLTKL